MLAKRINIAIITKEHFTKKIDDYLFKIWSFKNLDVNRILTYINNIKDDVCLYLEYPYVDKVYRDNYYHYFSSKYKEYKRDCIRVSIFSVSISREDLIKSDSFNKLQENYLGYFIIRPLENHLLGRSFLSPKAVKGERILCSLSDEKNLIGCHNLTCSGFPHISQDKETMTCAESSIWMLIEYYSGRYKEYKQVLPSDITDSLAKNSYKRLLPSDGLTLLQISQTVKEFGFSTKIYYNDKDKGVNTDNFYRYLYYYLESGIPVILGLGSGRRDGHAVVAIGHEEFYYLKNSKIKNIAEKKQKNVFINDTGLSCEKIIIMDDNHSPFISVPFDDPGIFYKNQNMKDLKIKYFIAPLYNKIYLDAEKAYQTFESVISDNKIGLPQNSKNNPYAIRFFLTSAKSFKRRISLMDKIDDVMKETLVYLSLPKFIWIGEITDNVLYSKQQANGIIIIDATGEQNKESVIFYYHNERLLDRDNQDDYLFRNKQWGCFSLYRNNLKGSWNAYNAY